MTSAYGATDTNQDSIGKDYAELLPYIPVRTNLSTGKQISIDFIHDEDDVEAVRKLLNDVIKEGMSWPFEDPLTNVEFRNYFLSHTALVARNSTGAVIGAFYCKPNFPGRCSHYCNGGFITDPRYRRQGVASVMGTIFLRIAKDLGFQAVLFNLVFTSNEASIRLWDKLGFKRLARLPCVGRLREGNFDAVQYYYDLYNVNECRFRKIVVPVISQLPRVSIILLAFLVGRFGASRRRTEA